MKTAWISLGAVCALVVGVYACMAQSGVLERLCPDAADTYYNLLVRGFRAGQLSLKKEAPPGLAQLADPYNPTANEPYRLGPDRLFDLSYYKGRLYLYFGVTPALILFWPFVALTGHYLSHRLAMLVFCTSGFLASVGVLYSAWRRYFSELNVWVVAAGALALGLATGVPILLSQSDVWEVPISCGYMLTMLALAAIWKALHHPSQRGWWLAAASLLYGLAVGARPSLLLGAVILLVPVIKAWRERRRIGLSLVAVTVPITLIGLGLMLYNVRRFDDPLEFGIHYQMYVRSQLHEQLFRLHYFWFNFRLYFLEPAHWSSRFPFVHDITVPPLPVGHASVEHPSGVLTNIPLVWLALAVPLAWRARSGREASTLRWFVTGTALLFVACALPLGFFSSAIIRYEVDFLPALVLLAVIGILSLERARTPTSESGRACRPVWRRVVRWSWSLLLGFSVAFNLLATSECYAETHYNLGIVLANAGKTTAAIEQFEQALRIQPDFAEAHHNLGTALERVGRLAEARDHFEQAVRLKPAYAEAYNNLGINLGEAGKYDEAVRDFEQALRIRPDFAEAHYNLGNALVTLHKPADALAQYKLALQFKPDYPEAQHNMGVAFGQLGRVQKAVGCFEEFLRANPNDAPGRHDLGIVLAQAGRYQEAIRQFEEALRIDPDYAEAHYNLGTALEKAGRMPEAIQHYQQALKLRPDLTVARSALVRLQAGQ
jgi:tetratricopeptide (TPR) repeat protein